MTASYAYVFKRLVAACISLVVVYLSLTMPPLLNEESYSAREIHQEIYNVHSERWIVVTTIAYPTADIRFLSQIPGWKVVVVGDTKTPHNWSHPNCVFLSINSQRQLGFETARLLPERSYSRKNVGYLFAIAHGAKFIYETDDDNRPLDLLQNFIYSPTTWGLLYDGQHLFNPYRHFGQPTLWPRGYPLASIGENVSIRYRLSHWNTPLIQQGLVNGDPDMDAIFRLTRKKTTTQLNVTFDNNAPPAIVPMGVFSPFNSQNTFFRYDALWALLIPTTTTFRVCDIWRGYWAQRLLWEIGGNLGFFPPNAFQKRNSHSYLSDAKEEKDLYFQTERLVKFLSEWQCTRDKSFFSCVLQLSQDMMKSDFWKHEDSVLTAAWISDLRRVGYREPDRISLGSLIDKSIFVPEVALPQQTRKLTQMISVDFWPAEQTPPLTRSFKQQNKALVDHVIKMTSYCKNFTQNFTNVDVTTQIPSHPNILLIVVFNFPHYENLHFLETLYRMHFPHIVYCGAHKDKYDRYSKLLLEPVTFIEVDTGNGWFAQHCLVEAMRLNYNVDGYLYIGDDTLINPWNINKQPIDKLWIKPSAMMRQSVKKLPWMWFNNPTVGLKTYRKALNATRFKDMTRFQKFFRTLAKNSGFADGMFRGGSDIAYVPRRLREDATYFLEHFSRFNLFVEMAIPIVFYGLDVPYALPGMYLWYDGKRGHIEKYFKKDSFFLHPVKLTKEFAKPKGKIFFCETFFPLTLTNR